MKNVITSKCCSIPQILLQILTWEGETYRLIYNLSTFGGVRSLKIRPSLLCEYDMNKICEDHSCFFQTKLKPAKNRNIYEL